MGRVMMRVLMSITGWPTAYPDGVVAWPPLATNVFLRSKKSIPMGQGSSLIFSFIKSKVTIITMDSGFQRLFTNETHPWTLRTMFQTILVRCRCSLRDRLNERKAWTTCLSQAIRLMMGPSRIIKACLRIIQFYKVVPPRKLSWCNSNNYGL